MLVERRGLEGKLIYFRPNPFQPTSIQIIPKLFTYYLCFMLIKEQHKLIPLLFVSLAVLQLTVYYYSCLLVSPKIIGPPTFSFECC